MKERRERSREQRGLMAYLEEIPDPRRPQGRVYPLSGLLGVLILAALNGESSLRGMWIWGREHWGPIRGELGIPEWRSPPQYGTLWNVLSKLPLKALGEALRRWGEEVGVEVEAVSVDGKTLRGSKRRSGLPAVQMVVAAAQGIGVVLEGGGDRGRGCGRSGVAIVAWASVEGEGGDARCGVESPSGSGGGVGKRGACLEPVMHFGTVRRQNDGPST